MLRCWGGLLSPVWGLYLMAHVCKVALQIVDMLPWLAAGSNKGKKGSVNGKKAEESDIFKLVRMIMQRKFDPVPPFLSSFMQVMTQAQCQ